MDKNIKIAVAGVNSDAGKFGYKIFNGLAEAGFNVFAVGVRGGQVNGKTVYKSLKELPQKPDIVVTVVPPPGTEKVTQEAIALGIKEIWMQPGSRSDTAVIKAREAGIKVTDSGCFMIMLGLW